MLKRLLSLKLFQFGYCEYLKSNIFNNSEWGHKGAKGDIQRNNQLVYYAVS